MCTLPGDSAISHEKMMKILQLNLNHCEVAQDLLTQSIIKENIDVAILSEHDRNREKSWERDSDGKAAIWTCGRLLIEERMKCHESCFVWVKVAGIYI